MIGDGVDESPLPANLFDAAAAGGHARLRAARRATAAGMPWPIAWSSRRTAIPNGLVVEEALAAGLPVIVSDAAGDIASRVPEGVAGYVFPVGAASELRRKRMVRVARSPALRPSPELTASMSVDGLRHGLRMPLWPRSRPARPQIPVLQPRTVCLPARPVGSLLVARAQRWRPAPYIDARAIRESVVRERPSSVRRVAGAGAGWLPT